MMARQRVGGQALDEGNAIGLQLTVLAEARERPVLAFDRETGMPLADLRQHDRTAAAAGFRGGGETIGTTAPQDGGQHGRRHSVPWVELGGDR